MKRYNILSIVVAFMLIAAWMPVNSQTNKPRSSSMPKSKNVPLPAQKPKTVKPAVPEKPNAPAEEPQVDKNLFKGLQNGNNQNKSKSLLDMIKEKNQSGDLLGEKADPVADLKAKAKDGDADAAYELGMYYYTGEEKDFKEAFKWFKKAHNGGNTQATLMMATCYYYGDGVEEADHNKAKNLYMVALQKGDESALELLNLLAEDDEPFFLQLLSDIYREGVMDEKGKKTIVEVDWNKSLEYLKRLADSGNVDGQIAVAKFYLEQENLTKAQQQEALKYLSKAVDAESVEAMLYMAEVYEKGLGGVKRDEAKSREYKELAAQGGDMNSLMNMAMVYYNQQPPTEESRKKAFHYFDLAANKGNLNALYFRGLMLYDGDGVEMDKDAAIGVLKEAAGKNHREAKAKLGEIYLSDKDKKRQDQGLELITEAAGLGSNQARWTLANCYRTGAGSGNVILRDYYKAAHWMSLVARGSYSEQYDSLMTELKENKDPFYVYLKGMKEFNDENYKDAIKLFKDVKKSSPADGQTMEAACYMKMNNHKQAVSLLEEYTGEYKVKTVVEENGKKKEVYEKYKCYPAACYYLGSILLEGKDQILKDEKKAMKLLETAAKEGIGAAQCMLGNIYYEKDKNKALAYYQQAEKQWAFTDYREVASKLALAYEDGTLKPIFKENKMDKYIRDLREIPEDYNPLKSMLDETEF